MYRYIYVYIDLAVYLIISLHVYIHDIEVCVCVGISGQMCAFQNQGSWFPLVSLQNQPIKKEPLFYTPQHNDQVITSDIPRIPSIGLPNKPSGGCNPLDMLQLSSRGALRKETNQANLPSRGRRTSRVAGPNKV